MMYHCKHFKGDVPCDFSKVAGLACDEDCMFFTPMDGRRLVIKLGALGDVVRTTPILHGLKEKFPKSEVWWLTKYPEVIPQQVDEILPFNLESVLMLQATSFNATYNLDKDREACALAYNLNATEKYGFSLHQGHPIGFSDAAEKKILTGIYDVVSKANTRSYQQEIFNICDLGEFNPEKHSYILPYFKRRVRRICSHGREDKIVVGISTGCGDRWMTRRWRVAYWIGLCDSLKNAGYEVMLLGGEKEDAFNQFLVKECPGVHYLGVRPILKFVREVLDLCDIVVTLVTATMHLALGLEKKVVVLNNIFNKNEFELYGRGKIVEPSRGCKCYYGKACKNREYQCMDSLHPDMVLDAVKEMEVLNEA